MTSYPIRALLVTASIFVVPALASAGERPTAMDGCISAFMQSMAQHATPVKLREAHYRDTGTAPWAVTDLVLTATDAHDNRTVARAVCKVDVRGQVVKLDQVPENALLP